MESRICAYVCVVVEGMYTCKTESFETSLCVYVCVVVEGMYICKIGHFGINMVCLCFGFCRGHVHMQDWGLWKQYFVFMFVSL